jgi:hypothetical protein
MDILEGTTEGKRVLLVCKEGVLRVIGESVSIDKADHFSREEGGIRLSGTHISLLPEDLEALKRMEERRGKVEKGILRRAIERDYVLGTSYSCITQEEESFFYKVNGERIRRSVEIRGGFDCRFRKDATEFILSNTKMLALFFSSSLSFSQFSKTFSSGFIWSGDKSQINELDRSVYKALFNEEMTSSLLDRINLLSALLLDETSLSLVGCRDLKEEEIPSLRMEEEKTSREQVDVEWPPLLKIEETGRDRVEEISRVSIDKTLLLRMKEVSRLVCRSGETEESRRVSERLSLLFKEEVRRRLAKDESKVAEELVKRIMPSFFLKGTLQ